MTRCGSAQFECSWYKTARGASVINFTANVLQHQRGRIIPAFSSAFVYILGLIKRADITRGVCPAFRAEPPSS